MSTPSINENQALIPLDVLYPRKKLCTTLIPGENRGEKIFFITLMIIALVAIILGGIVDGQPSCDAPYYNSSNPSDNLPSCIVLAKSLGRFSWVCGIIILGSMPLISISQLCYRITEARRG